MEGTGADVHAVGLGSRLPQPSTQEIPSHLQARNTEDETKS